MSIRHDISDKVVHFTSGTSDDEAFDRLKGILFESTLRGSSEHIRGGYTCICFTEAPLNSLSSGLVNPAAYSRYKPFGIAFDKAWLFREGARPVIYQSDDEFLTLSESSRWRHVRYEPHAASPIDFTWEREWRIRHDSLSLSPCTAALVLPDANWASRLEREHSAQQDWHVAAYSQIMDETLAESYREDFPWRVYCLA